jgi:hypothetical protein
MKKSVLLLLGTLLIAGNAFALLDDAQDNLGMYFDTQGDVVCRTAAFLNHVPAYILYTNPTLPSLRGFEMGLDLVGAVNTSVAKSFPVPTTDVGANNTGGISYNFIAGFAAPMLTSPATVLCTLDIFFLDFTPVSFICGPSAPSSNTDGLAMVMLEDFSLMGVDTSNMPGEFAAQINAPECMVVENEDASFGAVKALFR